MFIRRSICRSYLGIHDEGKSVNEIRSQYELDWTEWPADLGAPYSDVDASGFYDPTIDVPGVPYAAQTIWFVANDQDPALTQFLYGTNPVGIEYQATIWNTRIVLASIISSLESTSLLINRRIRFSNNF